MALTDMKHAHHAPVVWDHVTFLATFGLQPIKDGTYNILTTNNYGMFNIDYNKSVGSADLSPDDIRA